MQKPENTDEYIAGFPEEIQKMLSQIREAIHNAAPNAEEVISYGMPALKLNGTYLLYFSGYKKHVSLYPAPAGDTAFEKELEPYRSGKGTIRFALNKPLPFELLYKIVKYSIKAHHERAEMNKK